MFTRCPHCKTVFRVTPQQLQASSGQVRCGRCQGVFDAFASLSARFPGLSAPGLAQPARDEAQRPIDSAPVDGHAATTADAGGVYAAADVSEPGAGLPPDEPAVREEQSHDRAAGQADGGIEPALSIDAPAQAAEADAARGSSSPAVEQSEVDAPAAARVQPGAGELELPEDVMTAPEVSVKQRRRWLAVNTMLLATVAIQLVRTFATPVAVALPPLRPVLESACGVLGCTVGLPQLPDQLFIEASDLQLVDPARPSEVLLTATISNRASLAQQLPLLELTLMAGANQTAARKVLRPQEYLQRPIGPERGIAAHQQMEIRLYLHTGNILPTGYRLFLFFG